MFNIIRTAIDALFHSEPNYFRSIFGNTETWFPPYDEYSEFSIANINELVKFFKYTTEISVPPLLFFTDTLKPYFPDVLKPILFLEDPAIFDCHSHHAKAVKTEQWFFINGIGTNRDIAELNGEYISTLFKRTVTILHNPTDSLGIDLMQSMAGRNGDRNVKFASFVLPNILKALETKKKVVLIAHSQGTLLVSTILDMLIQQENPHLHKLEIYAFANCAAEMTHEPVKDPKNRPHIESFANEHDIVAKLGMLAPNKEARKIKIDGEHFIRKDAWGHFLNIHYLKHFANGEFEHETDSKIQSRLLQYL